MISDKIAMAIIAVALALIPIAGIKGYSMGYEASEQAGKDALKKANEMNSQKTKQLLKGVERVAEEAEKERVDIELRLADANDAVERLQSAVRGANASGNSSASCAADAEAARSILADCAARYRDVAREADKLRASVLGLQSYISEITK